jgi:hypothetical protein
MKKMLLVLLLLCNFASAETVPVGVEYQYHGDLSTWTKLIDPGYGSPEWFTIPFNQDKWLFVPNDEQLTRTKHLWLQIEWQNDPESVVDPIVWLPQGFSVTNTHYENYVWEWIITPQPGSEIIQFPKEFPWTGVVGIDVATECPEASTFVLLSICAVIFACKRFM